MSDQKRTPSRVLGIPFLDASGKIAPNKVFWVDSNASITDPDGSLEKPLATIDTAIGKCTASYGDIIYVKPGHAETLAVASAIAADVAGISIIGLGRGSNRPTLTYSATASTLVVSADNVKISNLRFTSAVNNLAVFITVAAHNTEIENCQFVTANTYEAYCFIGITTTYDWVTVRGCQFIQPTDPAGTDDGDVTGAIYFEDSNYIFIENCQFVGNFETAIFHNKTTLATQVWVKNCYGYNDLSTAQIYTLVEGTIGGDIGSLYTNPNATDVTTAQIFGTESTKFFAASYFGNDSVGGGQGAMQPTVAA